MSMFFADSDSAELELIKKANYRIDKVVEDIEIQVHYESRMLYMCVQHISRQIETKQIGGKDTEAELAEVSKLVDTSVVKWLEDPESFKHDRMVIQSALKHGADWSNGSVFFDLEKFSDYAYSVLDNLSNLLGFLKGIYDSGAVEPFHVGDHDE